MFRHFPVRGAHPRAFAAACAAEAAGRQGAFWPMHDALFADQGRLEDPHLWARAERLGLDVARFDADRRDDAVAARIMADFRGGVRAGVPTTPTLFHDGVRHAGRPDGATLGGSRTWSPERAYTAPMPAPPHDADDAVLVERLRADETGEAMRALYRLYGGELYGFTLNALGDRGAAEEIVQEVFLRAWRHAGRYDAERAAVRTWLYQIARNAIIDSRRRAAVRPGLPQHEPADERRGRRHARAGDARLAGRRGARAAHARAPADDPHGPVPRADDARDRGAHRAAARHGQEPHLVRAALAAARARGDGGDAGMSCDHIREELGGYVLGALEPAERDAVAAHLATCPACAAEHARLAELPALLAHAEGLEIPAAPAGGRGARARPDRARARRGPPAAPPAPAPRCPAGRAAARWSPARWPARRSAPP